MLRTEIIEIEIIFSYRLFAAVRHGRQQITIVYSNLIWFLYFAHVYMYMGKINAWTTKNNNNKVWPQSRWVRPIYGRFYSLLFFTAQHFSVISSLCASLTPTHSLLPFRYNAIIFHIYYIHTVNIYIANAIQNRVCAAWQ